MGDPILDQADLAHWGGAAVASKFVLVKHEFRGEWDSWRTVAAGQRRS